jgi:hypothetical protein
MYDIVRKMEELTEEERKYVLFKYFLNDNSYESYDSEILLDCLDDKHIDIKGFEKMLAMAELAKIYKHMQYGSNYRYEEVLIYYKSLLKKCNSLAIELKLNNSLEVSNLFTYLLWNGYFSVNRQNKYQIEKRDLILGLYSLDLLNGIGVCLNHSDMLCDLLNQGGYKSAILVNHLDRNIKRSYLPDIKRIITKPRIKTRVSSFLLRPISKKFGNHAFNLIREKGKIYIYDSTNLTINEVIDHNTANVIVGNGKIKLNPFFSYVLNPKYTSKRVLDSLYSKDLSSPYSEEDFKYSWEKLFDIVETNDSLVADYYEDSRKDILQAVSELKKIKSR